MEYIEKIFQAWIDFYFRIWLSLMDFLKDFFWWIIDNVFAVGIQMLNEMDFDLSALNPAQYINAIPPGVVYFMNQCGFNECMVIIVSALIIRFGLQLIPFVRWGS